MSRFRLGYFCCAVNYFAAVVCLEAWYCVSRFVARFFLPRAKKKCFLFFVYLRGLIFYVEVQGLTHFCIVAELWIAFSFHFRDQISCVEARGVLFVPLGFQSSFSAFHLFHENMRSFQGPDIQLHVVLLAISGQLSSTSSPLFRAWCCTLRSGDWYWGRRRISKAFKRPPCVKWKWTNGSS